MPENENVNLADDDLSYISRDGMYEFDIGFDPFKVAEITAYHGDPVNVTFRDHCDGLRVASIYADFDNNTEIETVTIGTPGVGIKLHDSYKNCTNLKSYTILSEHSEEYYSCYMANKNQIPVNAGINMLSNFENCIGLEEVKLLRAEGSWNSSISNDSFNNCTSLPEIVLDGKWKIYADAFINCTSLERIVFTSEVDEIEEHAFGYGRDESGNYFTDGVRPENMAIYGIPGTVAETYALENDIPFVSIDVEGDLNCDGKANAADLVGVCRYLIDSDNYSLISQGLINCDFTQDGAIDSLDAVAVRKFIVNT